MILAKNIRPIIKMNHSNDDIDGVQWIATTTTTKKNKDISVRYNDNDIYNRNNSFNGKVIMIISIIRRGN